MNNIASLVHSYERALAAAEAAAKPKERNLCSLLLQEFGNLQRGLNATDPVTIQESLASQVQLFGRSFLSGETGEAAEVAFNKVFRAIQSSGT